MKIISEQHVDVQEWDDLAAALGGGYFHSHAEAMFHATVTNTHALFIRAINEQGQCVGLTTGSMALSKIWPFSRHCGYAMLLCHPVVCDASIEAGQEVMEAIEEHLRHRGAFTIRTYSYDSLTCEPVLSALGYDLSERYEFRIDLTQDLDRIWSNMKGERRTDIRKAEKLGVVTRMENTAESLELAVMFQNRSRQHRSLSMSIMGRAAEANRKRLESGRINVLVSYQNDSPINAAIFGYFNGNAYYHVSGSSDLGFKCCGPVHLIWTAIKTYKERGGSTLNLGAALAEQTSLFRFKRDFGAEILSVPGGTKRISKLGTALHWLRSRKS